MKTGMNQDKLYTKIYTWSHEILQIANRASKHAQEENRKKGIPNVYDFNGHLYYELPNGELTKKDPLLNKDKEDSEEE